MHVFTHNAHTHIFMDSSWWMPLNVPNELMIRADPSAWTSGICATTTGQRIEDCFCSFCSSSCAFSEEYVYLEQLKLKKNSIEQPIPMAQGCEKYATPVHAVSTYSSSR